ncbi:MAG: hypothetical protein ABIZ34_02055 [Candidatus Limnocylindrales bacterium]
MIAAIALVAGIGLVAAGAVLLRRLGAGYRVARLLAVAPTATLAEISAMAATGERRYVKGTGRVSSDEEFPDEDARPLVYRRRRIQRGDGAGGWVTIDEERHAVAFGVEDRSTFVAIDADALGYGLVVVPRESTGVAIDLPADLVARLSFPLEPDVPIRLRIEQVSAVEHATVAGVPAIGPGGPMLTAGLGRPLIVSMVDQAAAMRLLAGDRRGSALAAGMLIVLGLGSFAVAVVAVVTAR